MGCGLRKLEDPEDGSPGKIYSTLKRPQVETKTDTVYEYVLLDFSLEGSRPTVQCLTSLCELPQALLPYYTQGYMLAALHPIILSVCRTRELSCNLLYRAVLTRPRPSKNTVIVSHSAPVLKAEEWPMPDSLTSGTVRALVDRVNSYAQGGMRFVGSMLKQVGGRSNGCNGRGCRPPPRTQPGDWDLEESSFSPDSSLLVLFHSWAPGCAPLDDFACCYHQGALSMQVSRKGQVISALEADWLEMTAAYYRRGWSLVDSFVYWDMPKEEPVARSLEGLLVFEERSTTTPANDTIVVEQWTVVEGSDVKTDYGPLLHTLAEFGWLLTCVLPTPVVRHDSDGNLATKQVVFLQRPVMTDGEPQQNKMGTLRKEGPSRSVSWGAEVLSEELSPSQGGVGGFSVFAEAYPGPLSHLDDGGFEQDDGTAEVTCM